MNQADFRFQDHGSICILTAQSDAAKEWCGMHLEDDAPRWGDGYAIERRCMVPIYWDLDADGFLISSGK